MSTFYEAVPYCTAATVTFYEAVPYCTATTVTKCGFHMGVYSLDRRQWLSLQATAAIIPPLLNLRSGEL